VVDETFALPAAPLQAGPVRLVDGPNVVHVFSLSKLGLAAERLGVIAAAPGIIEVLSRELRADTIAASYLGQRLAAALLEGTSQPGLGWQYRDRWRALRAGLGPVPDHAAVARWQGGPFLWLSWHGGPDDATVFRELLRHGIAVTPGSVLHATGGPVRGIRVGLGAPAGSLEQAGAQILASLRG
jgi:DNA-binding transcriptional MocR family regulator